MEYNTHIGHPPGGRILVECPPKKEKSEGGILLLPSMQDKQRQGVTRGRLIDAGLKARDMMKSAGWEFGDELTWGQYAAVYLEWKDTQGAAHEALALNFEDIMTNVDLAKRLAAGTKTIECTIVDGAPHHLILTNQPMQPAQKPGNGAAHAQR